VAPTYVFVEGESDAVALETLARRLGRDLDAENVRVVALHGVTNIGPRLAAMPHGARVIGLCDAPELRVFRRALDRSAGRLSVLACFACDPDLETELVDAVGTARVVDVITRERELEAFRTLQHQPAHRDGSLEGQLHRFIGTKSGRKIRYARLLTEAFDLTAAPRPLVDALAAARARAAEAQRSQ